MNDLFFDEICGYLNSFGIDNNIYTELLKYQRNMIKRPCVKESSFSIAYDFPDYFSSIYNNMNT